MEDSNDMLLLPVPKRLYARMVQALAQEMHNISKQGPNAAHSNDAVSTVLESEVVKSWTKEQTAELKRVVDNPTVRTMLNLAAERRGDWVALGDLEERLARPSDGIRADLAGLTRLCHKRFGKKGPNTDVWPLYVDWRVSADSVTRYRMPEEISRWWLDVQIDRQQTMRTRIEEFIQTEQGMVFDFSTSWYATWTLPEYAAPHSGQGNGWTPSKRVLLFSVQFGPDPNKPAPWSLHFSLIVGPTDQDAREVRTRLLKLASDPNLFPRDYPPASWKSFVWEPLRSEECLSADAYKDAGVDEAVEDFVATWRRFRDEGTLDAIRAVFRPTIESEWWSSSGTLPTLAIGIR